MTGWFALAFGLVLIGLGIRWAVRERRTSRRRREANHDLTASVTVLFVLGGLAALLGLAMLLVFPRR